MSHINGGRLYGYAGKLLRIDLGKGKVSVEETKPEIPLKFLLPHQIEDNVDLFSDAWNRL